MAQFISVNPTGCTGCRECEMICSLYHFAESNPELSAVRVARNEGNGLAEPMPMVCRQCDDPACMDACISGAIYKDKNSGLVKLDFDVCTGCRECISACPTKSIFFNFDKEKAVLCDLCGGDPQCIFMCHGKCLKLSEAASES